MVRAWAAAASMLAVGLVAPPALAVAGKDEPSVRPGINDNFLDPDLDVDEWVKRFEGESREVFAAREEVVGACSIRPGARIADIGAGTGLYTRLFSDAAGPDGWVYAVDIAPAFLEHISRQAAAEGRANVTAVLGRAESIQLPPGSIDLAFVCDTYHHFEYPGPTLASIHRALAPGGVLVVVDFERLPGTSREWTLEHVRAGKEVVRAEIEAAGFELVGETKIAGFEENYFLKFRRK